MFNQGRLADRAISAIWKIIWLKSGLFGKGSWFGQKRRKTKIPVDLWEFMSLVYHIKIVLATAALVGFWNMRRLMFHLWPDRKCTARTIL